jgi:predicted extracellular nuclease
MMRTPALITAFSLFSWSVASCPGADLYVAFWNVENLFDTVDDPRVEGDESFTPEGPKQWTTDRLRIKLANLARVIQDMNGGKGPDVLGLCEVENRDVIEALVDTLELPDRAYRIVHRDSPSERGIDCALLYDHNRLARDGAPRFHRVDVPRPTREIVEAPFRIDNKRLYVFVNHWPSKNNPESQRIKAAQTLRRRLDEILADDPQADIVAIGDLNDTPHDKSVGKHLKTWGDPDSLYPRVFFNSTWPIHRDRDQGSYVYGNKWELIDHVILSPGLLDSNQFCWKRNSTSVVKHDYQMYDPGRPGQIPRPSRTYTGNTFHANGYSDHLPIRCLIDF